jgi:hypothetical protein
LVIVCVYVMLLPAVIGFGVPLLVTVRSHASVTLVVVVVLLFVAVGSLVVDETEEVAVIVVAATVGATLTTTMIFPAEPAARGLESTQVTEVVVVQVQPTGADTETNVVLAGIASMKVAAVAAAGPLLVTVCV